jgi:hypothetical protein
VESTKATSRFVYCLTAPKCPPENELSDISVLWFGFGAKQNRSRKMWTNIPSPG